MGTFTDLDRYFDPGLTLTVRGKEYVLPLPSAELGLWCRRMAQTAGEITSASTEEEVQAAVDAAKGVPDLPGARLTLHERVLGDVYQQMMADQVPDPYIQFAGATAYVWIVGGEEQASRFWQSGGRPEAWGPTNRQERRAAQKTGGAAATKTRSPASTSGTRRPRKSVPPVRA
jgi:hypothetical protein